MSFVLVLALLTQPPGADIPGKSVAQFKNQKPMLTQDGGLAAHAEEALRVQANRGGGKQATVVICVGQESSPTGEAIRRAGEAAQAVVSAALPRAEVAWVARELEAEACPRGLLLESWQATGSAGASLRVIAGPVSLTPPGGKLSSAQTGSVVVDGAVLSTGDGGAAVLAFPDGAQLRIGAGTDVRVQSVAPSTSFALLGGRVLARRRNAGAWQASLGDFTVELDAGLFALSARGRGEAGIESLEGGATVRRGEESVAIAGGEGVVSGDRELVRRDLPAAPLRLRPTRGAFPLPVSLGWEAATGAARYEIELAATPTFEHVIHNATSETPSYTLGARVPPGPVFWRVISVDENGLHGRPSAVFRIQLDGER